MSQAKNRYGRVARWGLAIGLSAIWGCETGGTAAGGFRLGGNPDEEVWAIRCITLQGPERFTQAEAYAEALRRAAGLKAERVQVITDEDGTAVFYGRYRREYGPGGTADRFVPNHLQDLETIRGLRFRTADVWPFILAAMDVLPTYRSEHPEWNLATAEGHWSLHVAVFYNTDAFRARRSAAEEYCRLLREQGEPAYYHHGTVHSSVYVGTYPKSAVAEVRDENPFTGRVAVTMRIVDPEMQAAQQRYPISLHNGHTMYEVVRSGGQTQRLPAPSFPVILPKAEDSK